MARPTKQTVDYFPHTCNHKQTIFILEERYGNTGYAFWFKLLELLGNTPGHCVVFSTENPAGLEFLAAKTHLATDKALEILGLLAKLQAIDSELWTQHQVVWSQNFVDGIEDAYRDRKIPVPTKPSFPQDKPTCSGVSSARNTSEQGFPAPENHKGNNTKLKEIIGNKTKAVVPAPAAATSPDKEFGEVVQYFENNICGLTAKLGEDIGHYYDLLPTSDKKTWFIQAIDEAVSQNKRRWSYIEAILKRCIDDKTPPGNKQNNGAEGQQIPPPPPPPYVPDHTVNAEVAEEVWNHALKELKGQVAKANYETWLQHTHGVSYKAPEFVVECPSAFAAEWARGRLSSLVTKALLSVTHWTTVKVYFRVKAGSDDS